MSSQANGVAPDAPPVTWGAVLPVKPLRTAKSRLGELGDDVRRDLVVAFLHDTLSAVIGAAATDSVVVVTDDVTLAETARRLGAWSITDGQTDLNASLVRGADEVLRRTPGSAVLASCADLPALRGSDLDAWLSVPCETSNAFVADAAGSGTTMLRSLALSGFTPAFGHGSRAAHERLGISDLSGAAAPGLRHDVDTPRDLAAVAGLRLGERTRWVLTKHRL